MTAASSKELLSAFDTTHNRDEPVLLAEVIIGQDSIILGRSQRSPIPKPYLAKLNCQPSSETAARPWLQLRCFKWGRRPASFSFDATSARFDHYTIACLASCFDFDEHIAATRACILPFDYVDLTANQSASRYTSHLAQSIA
jgi:hypothetical protein